jgi:hypothetical protein
MESRKNKRGFGRGGYAPTSVSISHPHLRARLLRPYLAVALGLIAYPVCAQELPFGLATAGSPSFGASNTSSTLALSHYDAVAYVQTDVVLGRDSAGPYLLSWKNAHAGTEIVSRNGVVLHADTEYQLDFAAGAISFTLPLRAGEMVRLTYRCDTLNATRNSISQAVPLQWEIWQSGQTSLRFSSLYRLNPPSSAPQATTNNGVTAYTALQFTGDTQLMRGATGSAGLFLDIQDSDWMRRGGWQIGEQTRIANQQLAFTYARAGSLFSQSDVSGILAGRELLQATDTITPLKQLSLNLFARQTTLLVSPTGVPIDQTASDVNGNVTRETGGTVALALAHGGKVSAGSTITEQMPATGDGSQTTHDTVQIVSPSIHNTQATISLDTQTTGAITTAGTPGDAQPTTYTQTTTLGIKSAPSKLVTVTGTFQNTLDGSNPLDSGKITVEATPIAKLTKLKLTTSYEDRYQSDGVVRNRSALIDLPPLAFGQLHFSGGIQQSSTPGKELNVGLLNLAAKPLPYIEFSGATRLRDGTLGANLSDPNVVNTYSASLAVAPIKSFKITGNFARNPEAADGAVQKLDRQALGLQAQLGFVAVHGQYGIESDYVNTRINNTADLGVDLHLTKWDTLTTGLKLNNLYDKTYSGQTTYQLGFSHRFGTVFDLTLSSLLTTYDQDGRIDPDRTEVKAQAKLGLHF